MSSNLSCQPRSIGTSVHTYMSEYIHLYIFMYGYMNTATHTYIHMCIYICINNIHHIRGGNINICITYMYKCIYIEIEPSTCAMKMYMYIQYPPHTMWKYTHIYNIHIYIYIYIHLYIYIGIEPSTCAMQHHAPSQRCHLIRRALLTKKQALLAGKNGCNTLQDIPKRCYTTAGNPLNHRALLQECMLLSEEDRALLRE